MKYKLQIRTLNESDLRPECPYIPSEDQFEMYIAAFKEDIQMLDIVISLTQIDTYLIIEIESESTEHSLHSAIQKIYTRHYWPKLRVVIPGLEPVY